MTRRESSIERACREWAEARGMILRKCHPVPKGWPDRELILPGGVTLRVEFKRPGEKPSPAQEHWHGMLAAIGHTVWVCDSVDEFKATIEAILQRIDERRRTVARLTKSV